MHIPGISYTESFEERRLRIQQELDYTNKRKHKETCAKNRAKRKKKSKH